MNNHSSKLLNMELPWPPSTNQIWRNVVIKGKPRTLLSAAGRGYRSAVLGVVLQAGAKKGVTGRIRLDITAHPPDKRKRDLDNMLKAPLDALTHAGVWLDDSQVDALLIERGEVCKGGRLLVAISYEK